MSVNRARLIADLEVYWYQQQAKNPDEPMDIPCAISYYHAMPTQHLVWEYEQYLGTAPQN